MSGRSRSSLQRPSGGGRDDDSGDSADGGGGGGPGSRPGTGPLSPAPQGRPAPSASSSSTPRRQWGEPSEKENVEIRAARTTATPTSAQRLATYFRPVPLSAGGGGGGSGGMGPRKSRAHDERRERRRTPSSSREYGDVDASEHERLGGGKEGAFSPPRSGGGRKRAAPAPLSSSSSSPPPSPSLRGPSTSWQRAPSRSTSTGTWLGRGGDDMSRTQGFMSANPSREASLHSARHMETDEDFDAMIRGARSFADQPQIPSPPRPGTQMGTGERTRRSPAVARRGSEQEQEETGHGRDVVPARSPIGAARGRSMARSYADEDESDMTLQEHPGSVAADYRLDRTPSRGRQLSPQSRRPRSAQQQHHQGRKNPPQQASASASSSQGPHTAPLHEPQHPQPPPQPPPPPPPQQQHHQPPPPPHPYGYPPGPYGYGATTPSGPPGGHYMTSPYVPPPPGYYVAPPPGAYYGGYGHYPPSPYHGYAPHPPPHGPPPGWPVESPYGGPPPLHPPPPPPPVPSQQQQHQHMQGMGTSAPGGIQPPYPSEREEYSHSGMRDRRPTPSPRESDEMMRRHAPPSSAERRHRLTPRTDPPDDISQEEGMPSSGMKSPPYKKRKAIYTPKTAATAATADSTPPDSERISRPGEVIDTTTTTVMAASPPYPSPPQGSSRRTGQRSPERYSAVTTRTPQRSPPPVGFRASPSGSIMRSPGGGLAISRAPTFTVDTPGGGNGDNLVDPARLDDFSPIDTAVSFGIDAPSGPSDGEGEGGGERVAGNFDHEEEGGEERIRDPGVRMSFERSIEGMARAAMPSADRGGGRRGLFGDERDDEERGATGAMERVGTRPPSMHRRAGVEASPFTSFMGELESPYPSSHLQGSPLSSYRRDSSRFGGGDYYERHPRGAPGEREVRGERLPESIPSLSRRDRSAQQHSHPGLEASPLSVPPGSVGRQQALYPSDRPSPPSRRPFRLELGSIGSIKQTEARRGLGDINSALRGVRAQSPSRLPEYGSAVRDGAAMAASGYSYRGPESDVLPPSYEGDLRTPIKTGIPLDASVGVGSAARSARTPSVMVASVGPPPSAHGLPPGSMSSHRAAAAGMGMPPSAAKYAAAFPTATPMKTPASVAAAAAASVGKENATPKRRNPCNCKKSKCLKLYCECFAAEVYCDGCNCHDCSNNQAHDAIRSKAIRDTKAKNPNAFKSRVSVKPGFLDAGGVSASPPTMAHNMGCRCKKSACLKKYCECFEAGVMCGNKCKCAECLNFVGSQALIDRRRKIKDHKGAEMAMRTADEAWKSGGKGQGIGPQYFEQQQQQKAPPHSSQKRPASAGRGTPVSGMQLHAHMTYPSPARGGPMHHPSAPPHHGQGAPPPHMSMPPMYPSPPHGVMPHYMSPPSVMTGHHGRPPPPPAMAGPGYSPMGMHHAHHSYASAPSLASRQAMPGKAGGQRAQSSATGTGIGSKAYTGEMSRTGSASRGILLTPMTKASPRVVPAIRLQYDIDSARVRRRARLGGKEEPLRGVFGPTLPKQAETTALEIFSYLSNEDLYNASLVCRGWNSLSMNEELWQYGKGHAGAPP